MAKDLLAARRQQGSATSNPFSTGKQDYEMSNVTGSEEDMRSFYAEISAIQAALKAFNNDLTNLPRSPQTGSDSNAARNLMNELQQVGERIKTLEKQGGAGRNGQIRKQQTALVKSKLREAIQNFQAVEQKNRTAHAETLARQIQIVNPNATDEDVKNEIEHGTGQIFSEALMNSHRDVYTEVQQRHVDIKSITKTLEELNSLFNEMSVLIEQQDETIHAIEATAADVEKDTHAGLGYTEKAVVSARAARKKRWICFFLILVILIIVAVVVAVVVLNNQKK